LSCKVIVTGTVIVPVTRAGTHVLTCMCPKSVPVLPGVVLHHDCDSVVTQPAGEGVGGIAVGVGPALVEGATVAVGLGRGEGVGVAVGPGVAEGVTVGVGVEERATVAVGVGVGEGLGRGFLAARSTPVDVVTNSTTTVINDASASFNSTFLRGFVGRSGPGHVIDRVDRGQPLDRPGQVRPRAFATGERLLDLAVARRSSLVL
jgi:hypothetical protein